MYQRILVLSIAIMATFMLAATPAVPAQSDQAKEQTLVTKDADKVKKSDGDVKKTEKAKTDTAKKQTEKAKSDTKKKEAVKAEEKKEEELKLDSLFPKKTFFGPSASSMKFSPSGKYAAYLYRPNKERRHGSDLWLYNVKTGKPERVTTVSMMAPFQKSTRKVQKERIDKAKKEKEKTKDEAIIKAMDAGDWVGDDDATINDDEKKKEKAATYRGISSFEWAERSDKMIFSSEGDLYLYKVGDKAPQRLTRTRDSESRITWLRDDRGFLYQRGSALMKVTFGRSFIEELSINLPSGDSLSRYNLSPDGKKLAILASKTITRPSTPNYAIAKYTSRHMKAQTVSRHVLDDPPVERDYIAYLYEINEPIHENPTLIELHRFRAKLPSDRMSTPEWSPNSQKVSFIIAEQDSGLIHIYEGTFPEEAKKPETKTKPEEKKEGDKDEKKKPEPKEEKIEDKGNNGTPVKSPAKELYSFLHRGGPNTPSMMEPYYLYDNRRIVFMSELSGFRHLHVLDPIYETVEPLTSGHYELYPQEISKDRRWVYATATKEHPSRTDVYKIAMVNGEMTRLSPQRGVYSSAAISRNGKQMLANFERYGSLKELVSVDVAKKKQRVLTDSHSEKAHKITEPRPTMFSFKNRHDQDIYGQMFKPDDWTRNDKRPLLIYVYGGPLGTRKMVRDGDYSTSAYFFGYYMAKKHGYVTCTIDTRGNSGYGGLFEKSNFEQVGKPQVEDLEDAVKIMGEKYGVDTKRASMHGWSFGGFQTQMCMYTKPDLFMAGIAGAGPTEWENYNSWYTRQTIGESRTGSADLSKYSLLPLAKNLKGQLLLIHGMEDSNVLYQDTVRVYRELLKANKATNVELFLDPTGGHGLGGDVQTLQRFQKYEQFLLRIVGKGEPLKVEKKEEPKKAPKKEEKKTAEKPVKKEAPKPKTKVIQDKKKQANLVLPLGLTPYGDFSGNNPCWDEWVN